MIGVRSQIFARKQRMPTGHFRTHNYAFNEPYARASNFVDHKQNHCRPEVHYSQSENRPRINREEFSRNISVWKDSCEYGSQSENAMNKAIQTLIADIAKFESLAGDMSRSNSAK